jgi:hypothetical protein
VSGCCAYSITQSEAYLHTGGTHPKSKVLDADGWLALSKFPS